MKSYKENNRFEFNIDELIKYYDSIDLIPVEHIFIPEEYRFDNKEYCDLFYQSLLPILAEALKSNIEIKSFLIRNKSRIIKCGMDVEDGIEFIIETAYGIGDYSYGLPACTIKLLMATSYKSESDFLLCRVTRAALHYYSGKELDKFVELNRVSIQFLLEIEKTDKFYDLILKYGFKCNTKSVLNRQQPSYDFIMENLHNENVSGNMAALYNYVKSHFTERQKLEFELVAEMMNL